MEEYKLRFAHDPESLAGWKFEGRAPKLLETIKNARATVLLGLSGQPHTFSEPIVRAMGEISGRPIIFPLSNPTSLCEALPEDILAWTEGRAIVATGSPFAPVVHGAKTIQIGQGNNAFIFPGLGFGAILADVTEITDAMVMAAARTAQKRFSMDDSFRVRFSVSMRS